MRTLVLRCSILPVLFAAAGITTAQAPPPESVRPRLVLQTGHSAAITDLAFSRDGNALITGSADRTARTESMPLSAAPFPASQ